MSTWNRKRFSVFTSDEKDVLGLIEELGEQTNNNTDVLDNKTDLFGDHKGSWQGLSKPTLSDEGMRATVEKHINDIADLNTALDEVNTKLFVSVKDYGAIGNGIVDDTQAIQRCFDNEKYVLFPSGSYKITTNISFGNIEIIGYGEAEICFDQTFVAKNTFPCQEAVLYNKNFQTSLANPNTFKIDGIKFVNKNTDTSNNTIPYTIMTIANTINSSVKNCSFLALNRTNKSVCGFDGYSSNVNFIFDNNLIEINTYGTYGGSWFRNIGSGASDGITIINNKYINTQHDECLAVYGYQGGMKNVIIKNNTFIHKGNVVNVVTLGGNDTTVSGGNETAYLENVIFKDNFIKATNCSSKVLQISMECESKYIKNIKIEGNTIELLNGATTTRLISVYRGDDVVIKGNALINTSSIKVVGADTSVIALFSDNSVKGIYEIAIRGKFDIVSNVFTVSCQQTICYNYNKCEKNKFYPQNQFFTIVNSASQNSKAYFVDNYIQTAFSHNIQQLSYDNNHVIKGNTIEYTTANNGYLVYVGKWNDARTVIKDNIIFNATSDKLISTTGGVTNINNTFIKV